MEIKAEPNVLHDVSVCVCVCCICVQERMKEPEGTLLSYFLKPVYVCAVSACTSHECRVMCTSIHTRVPGLQPGPAASTR